MAPTVYIAGNRADVYGIVADLQDSTIWRSGGYSGDYEASFTWAAPVDFNAPWFQSGAEVRIAEGGREVWLGFLGEPANDGQVWQLTAYGSGADAENFACLDLNAANMNAEFDGAVSRGLKFGRGANDLTGGAMVLSESTSPIQLDQALSTLADTLGKVWWVRHGEVSLRSEGTGVDWMMAPDSAYLGTTDETFYTALRGVYAITSGTSSVTVTDAAGIAKFGRKEGTADLTQLGVLTSTQATGVTTNLMALVGSRFAYTNGFEMNTLNSWSTVSGVSAPLSVRAGQRVMLTGITDMRTGATYHAAVPVTLGKVTRVHAENRAVCEPVGMKGRDFQAALRPDKAMANRANLIRLGVLKA